MNRLLNASRKSKNVHDAKWTELKKNVLPYIYKYIGKKHIQNNNTLH